MIANIVIQTHNFSVERVGKLRIISDELAVLIDLPPERHSRVQYEVLIWAKNEKLVELELLCLHIGQLVTIHTVVYP